MFEGYVIYITMELLSQCTLGTTYCEEWTTILGGQESFVMYYFPSYIIIGILLIITFLLIFSMRNPWKN